MFVQADKRGFITDYLTVIDKINEGLFGVRNELCMDRFNLNYNKLNLSDSTDKKIKIAIDEVYPVKLVSVFIMRAPPEPPPPPHN